MLIYGIALWMAGDKQGAVWNSGEPFMDSVRNVVPHMVWRFVAGLLMLASHVLFAINVWKMRPGAFTMAFETPAE